jgi:hypothetical protein
LKEEGLPYRVKIDELSVLRALGPAREEDGRKYYDHDSVTWYKDDVIPDDQISPVVIEAYERGEEHTLSVLEKVQGGSRKAQADAPADSDGDTPDETPKRASRAAKPAAETGAE